MPTPNDILVFGQRLLEGVFGGCRFEEDVFLCGGSFKALLNSRMGINDVDLWVRDRKRREALREALVNSGARVVRDFQPYCIRMDHAGYPVEINYQNVKDRPITTVLDGFDMAVCCVAVHWRNGQVVESYAHEQYFRSAHDRCIRLQDSFLDTVRQTRPPSLLRTLDRMEKAAQELEFSLASEDVRRLWDLFMDYSEEQKRECLDNYLETMVGYKGRCNAPVLRRACELLGKSECLIALAA
ncbi:MAG: hypothetical protein KA004_00160 [Verrucomicrobiales bacterium]|nr:hypothetical protein [Verrucomicrobiales bacterium]